MSNQKLKIKNSRVTEVAFKTIPNIIKHVKIQVEQNAKLREPIDATDSTCFIQMEMKFKSENSEALSMNIVSETVVEFDERPENFEEAMKEFGMDIVSKNMMETINKLLENMGCPPFNVNSER